MEHQSQQAVPTIAAISWIDPAAQRREQLTAAAGTTPESMGAHNLRRSVRVEPSRIELPASTSWLPHRRHEGANGWRRPRSAGTAPRPAHGSRPVQWWKFTPWPPVAYHRRPCLNERCKPSRGPGARQRSRAALGGLVVGLALQAAPSTPVGGSAARQPSTPRAARARPR